MEKEAEERTVQSCFKVVQCPSDTVNLIVTSSRTRQYLTKLLPEADLVIWNVSADQLEHESDFQDGRLAGKMRENRHFKSIVTLKVPQ